MLIHGSWHGAWCWESVAELLRAKGHQVATPDLPGHGGDATPPHRITLGCYTASVASVLAGLPEAAVVAGHSFGGVVASQTAELYPERVRSLVFICGLMLRHGQSAWRHGFPSPRAEQKAHSALSPQNLIVREREGVLDLPRLVIERDFYPDCSPTDRMRALQLWRPEPLAPLKTALSLGEGFGRIPRTYIRCRDDRVIPKAAQERMCRLLPCERVVEMACGHSPFLSQPDVLAGHLQELAEQLAGG